MKTLLLTDPMPAGHFTESILAIAPDVQLIEYRGDIGDAELADIEVVLGWRFRAGVAGRLPSLKWVCAVAAGFETPPQIVDRGRGH
jgi:phosphoglycerate dehydrogenase-like enzyme